jgi:hypothetical protein
VDPQGKVGAKDSSRFVRCENCACWEPYRAYTSSSLPDVEEAKFWGVCKLLPHRESSHRTHGCFSGIRTSGGE